jgi:hypothetical protein
MSTRVEFLSLFVPDLSAARDAYATVFGIEPEAASGSIPHTHPYSPQPPVVFDLGTLKLALYQIDGHVTHAGDVGIGTTTDDLPGLLARAQRVGADAMPAVEVDADQDAPKRFGVVVFPAQHFFELIAR